MIGFLFQELKRRAYFLGSCWSLPPSVWASWPIAAVRFLVWIAATRLSKSALARLRAAIVGIVFLGCLAVTALLSRRSSESKSEVRGQTSEVAAPLSGAILNNPQFAIRNAFDSPPPEGSPAAPRVTVHVARTCGSILRQRFAGWLPACGRSCAAHTNAACGPAQWSLAGIRRNSAGEDRRTDPQHRPPWRAAGMWQFNDSFSTTALGETTSLLYFSAGNRGITARSGQCTSP